MFKDTKTTTWIEKHVPISVSFSSNLVEQPIFLCNSDSRHLVAYFIIAYLERLASQSIAQLKLLFFDIETKNKIRINWGASSRNSANFIIDGSP